MESTGQPPEGEIIYMSLVRFINRTEIEVERFEKNIYETDLNEE